MKKETYVCDVCGAEKKIANHWFRVLADIGFSFYRWDAKLDDIYTCEHICGRECLNKRIEKWLSS